MHAQHSEGQRGELSINGHDLSKLSERERLNELVMLPPGFESEGPSMSRWRGISSPIKEKIDEIKVELTGYISTADVRAFKNLENDACSLLEAKLITTDHQRGGILAFIAGIEEAGGKLYDAISYHLRSADAFRKSGDANLLCRSLGRAHRLLLQKMHDDGWEEGHSGWQLVEDIEQEIASHFSTKSTRHYTFRGQMVEQGEIGYTSHEPIGTWNVHECVAVAVKHLESGEMFLAHVDADRDLSGLDRAIDRLQVREGDHVQVRLLGARYGGQQGLALDPEAGARSLLNVLNILEVLRLSLEARGVKGDIVSSQVAELSQPSELVVDPSSFTMSISYPAQEEDNATLRRALSLLSDETVAFREVVEGQTGPLVLQDSEHEFLQLLLQTGNGHGFYEVMKESYDFSEVQCAVIIHNLKIAREALAHAYIPFLSGLDQQVKRVQGDHPNAQEAPDLYDNVFAFLRRLPVAIGEGSHEINQPLIEIFNDPRVLVLNKDDDTIALNERLLSCLLN